MGCCPFDKDPCTGLEGVAVAGACSTTLQRINRSLNDPDFLRSKDLKLSTTSRNGHEAWAHHTRAFAEAATTG
jgi:hypothetical protein